MNTLRPRSTLVAAAIASALALTACGDGRNDNAATRDSSTVATTPSGTTNAPGTPSSPYASDRMTADASSAAARSSDSASASRSDATGSASATASGRNAAATAERAGERTAAKADNAADRAAAKADNAGDRAAAAAGDAALTAKVKAALMAEPGIDSLQIDVDTANARVTLSGEVDNAQNRQRALQVARGVDGVNGVVDRLSVRR